MSHEQGRSVLTHEQLIDRGLHMEAARLLTAEFFPGISGRDRRETIQSFAADPGLYAILGEDGLTPEGAALLDTQDTVHGRSLSPGEGHLSRIAVAQKGRGIGSSLLEGIQRDAAERRGVRTITVSVSPGDSVPADERSEAMTRLRRFYERNGYRQDQDEPNRYVKRLQ